MGRAAAVVAVAVAALALAAAPAAAHTQLVGSTPAQGSTVATLDRVVLRFAGPVESSGSHVWLEDDGGTLDLGSPTHPDGDRRALEASVPSIAGGAYRLGFHVISADGAVVSGATTFVLDRPGAGVGSDAPPPPPVVAAEPPPAADLVAPSHDHPDPALPAGVARVLLDAALASLIGGVAFVVTVWPQGASSTAARRLLWTAVVAAAVASFVLAVVERAGLDSRLGRIAFGRMVLLSLAALLTTRLRDGARPTWRIAAVGVAVGLFESVVLLGHDPRPGSVAGLARLVHAAGVSVWMGGLVMLFAVVLPRRRTDELAAVARRFSRLATVAVVLAMAGGTALAIDVAGVGPVLPSGSYATVLVAKVAVVGVVLAVAARARRSVRDGVAAHPVAQLVAAELALLVVVLSMTAVLLSQRPPT